MNTIPHDWIIPDWPAPETVNACVTTRVGGVSRAPYDAMNLGDHVGDDPAAVCANRELLKRALHLPGQPVWLQQVHGTRVAVLDDQPVGPAEADASTTRRPGLVCAVLTADCLPVLFCDASGRQVAVAHAGWRGLAAGVLEHTIRSFSAPPEDLMAWLGPAIGPQQFEVGAEVRDEFVHRLDIAAEAFSRRDAHHWLSDIYCLARQRLRNAGVANVYGGGFCTVTDVTPDHAYRFYSYRRDKHTGRMASLIWMETV